MRVLIVDDHDVVRAGTRIILQGSQDDISFDEAANGQMALQKALGNDYDLVLLDLTMPDISGFEVLEGIKQQRPQLPVIVVSAHQEEQYAVRAYTLGADGYVGKGAPPAELLHAIDLVTGGGKFISEQVMNAVVQGLRQAPITAPRLSKREKEIADLLVAGQSNKEISWQLDISVKTVSTHKTRILKKLNLKNVTGLVRHLLDA